MNKIKLVLAEPNIMNKIWNPFVVTAIPVQDLAEAGILEWDFIHVFLFCCVKYFQLGFLLFTLQDLLFSLPLFGQDIVGEAGVTAGSRPDIVKTLSWLWFYCYLFHNLNWKEKMVLFLFHANFSETANIVKILLSCNIVNIELISTN